MHRFGPSYLKRFSGGMPLSHKKVISDIQQCRTEAKGGHIYQCERCGKKVYVYHACRKGGRWLPSRIEGAEFVRRYLQHVLPKGFHKVRYYGIWHKSNANHVSTLAGSIILAAIMSGRPIAKRENEDQAIAGKKLKCPHCGGDQLILLEQLPRPRSRSP
jgi:predicted RNA-binding Zn-ribbon protein involved in translation (DUF1610 family)